MLNSLDSTVSSTSTCSSVKEQHINKHRLHLDINYILEASKDPHDKWEQLEQNINEWLDEQNIYIVDPILKKKEYYQSLKQCAIEEQLRDENNISLHIPAKRIHDLKLDIEINCLQQRRGNRFSHGIQPSSSF